MPRAEAALVVLGLSGQNCGHEAGDLYCTAKDCGTRYGVLLVRHGRGSAATRRMWFGNLLHFRLHVEGEVVSDFVECAGEHAKGGGNFADAVAVGVPGN